jgi:FixJ family two-component response regulator
VTAERAPAIFIIDDDPSVRTSLARVVTGAGYTVEAFASGHDFMARERFVGPCCVVLDVRMPGLTGLDLQEAVLTAGRRVPIVFTTGHAALSMAAQAATSSADDELTEPFDVPGLVDAIHRAVAKDASDLDEAGVTAEIVDRMRLLTPREAEVLTLVVSGMLNKQVAAELGIVEQTVKVHRARVMEKLRAGSVADLVRMADRAGVILPAARGVSVH